MIGLRAGISAPSLMAAARVAAGVTSQRCQEPRFTGPLPNRRSRPFAEIHSERHIACGKECIVDRRGVSSKVPRQISALETLPKGQPLIRRALPSDAEKLGAIGPAAYSSAYSYLWDNSVALAKQLAAAFAELLSGTDARVWVAQIDGSLVGFLSMIVGSSNPISREPNGAEIPRVYLLPGAQRLGLGRQLLAAAIKQAHDERLTHIWLDVMASADWARRAYLKWGFSELGSKFFDKPVKAGQNDMVVLIKRFSYD
jgi:diamine N-acetyltransferase